MFQCPLSRNARADLKKSNALARALFYFVSFIYDHPVFPAVILEEVLLRGRVSSVGIWLH